MAKIDETRVRELLTKVLSGEVTDATVASMLDGRCLALDRDLLYRHDFFLCYRGTDKVDKYLHLMRTPGGSGPDFRHLVGLDHQGNLRSLESAEGALVELCLENGILRIRDLDSPEGTILRREVTGRRLVLCPDDVLQLGDSKLEISVVVPPESAAEDDKERRVMFAFKDARTTLERIRELLDRILKGEIAEEVVAAVLRGYQAAPIVYDCLHAQQFAVRCRMPNGRTGIHLLSPDRPMSVGRKGEIRLDDTDVEDRHLELSVVDGMVRAEFLAPSDGATLVRRIRTDGEMLDLDETLIVGGMECSFQVKEHPRPASGSEEDTVLFNLADLTGQPGPIQLVPDPNT